VKDPVLSIACIVAEQFSPESRVISIHEFGKGNINTTFSVSTKGKDQSPFILQLINSRVFPDPHLVMKNIRTATDHIHQRLEQTPLANGRRWEVPMVIPAKDGRDCVEDDNGGVWRAVSYIDAQSFDMVQGILHAKEVGLAVGLFHWLLSDLPPETLADTLKRFHDTPAYLNHFNEVKEQFRGEISPEVKQCIDFVTARSGMVRVLKDAAAKGLLRIRPIHGDPKVDNVMIDINTGHAVGIVDLDTVKPGLVHYDIGDCLRSCCNPVGEEIDDLENVSFDMALCKAVLQGYFTYAKEFLTENDYDYIYDASRLIAFELGLRFFTDYMEGNVYFKVKDERHNLRRARVQFRLCECIERQGSAIRRAIEDMR